MTDLSGKKAEMLTLFGEMLNAADKAKPSDAPASEPRPKTGMFEEAPGQTSVRRVVFFITFVFSMAFCLLGLKFEITEQAKELVIALFALASTVMGAGRFAEAMENRKGGDDE
jgi:hypothetical protein